MNREVLMIDASRSPKNSTNVRSSSVEVQLLRAALRGAELVAPFAAERVGAEIFARPRRGKRVAPPAVAGRAAERHTIASGAYSIAAWSWGEGPTVLLVHGWEGRAAQLVPFVEPLLEE